MKAIYAGSFDMFTEGHMDILQQASDLFDEIDVIIGVNSNKQRRYKAELIKSLIEESVKDYLIKSKINVVIYDGLIAKYAKDNNCNYLIRGIRNVTDYAYEENIASINNELNSNLKTLYFRANNSFISSSMVYELIKHNENVDNYLPYDVEKLK